MKTRTFTVSDVTKSPLSETATKERPMVHTETKTITYESAQVSVVKSFYLAFFACCIYLFLACLLCFL